VRQRGFHAHPDDCYRREIEEFLFCVRTGSTPRANADTAYATQQVIEAAYRAALWQQSRLTRRQIVGRLQLPQPHFRKLKHQLPLPADHFHPATNGERINESLSALTLPIR
jgi:predicted dehydrogenase